MNGLLGNREIKIKYAMQRATRPIKLPLRISLCLVKINPITFQLPEQDFWGSKSFGAPLSLSITANSEQRKENLISSSLQELATAVMAAMFSFGLTTLSPHKAIRPATVPFTPLKNKQTLNFNLSSSHSISGLRPLVLSKTFTTSSPVERNSQQLTVVSAKGYKMKTHKAILCNCVHISFLIRNFECVYLVLTLIDVGFSWNLNLNRKSRLLLSGLGLREMGR